MASRLATLWEVELLAVDMGSENIVTVLLRAY